jgi:hypothetical protein
VVRNHPRVVFARPANGTDGGVNSLQGNLQGNLPIRSHETAREMPFAQSFHALSPPNSLARRAGNTCARAGNRSPRCRERPERFASVQCLRPSFMTLPTPAVLRNGKVSSAPDRSSAVATSLMGAPMVFVVTSTSSAPFEVISPAFNPVTSLPQPKPDPQNG